MLAKDVLHGGAAALGQTVGGLANVLDPALILLGGGVLGLGTWYVEAVAPAVTLEVLVPLDPVPVRAAILGGDAMLVGAAATARTARA